MCSITILKEDGKVFITMNRDEDIYREVEHPPARYGDLIYPKDGRSEGTWFAVSTVNGSTSCLMNRYDEVDYDPELSRGEIVLKTLQGENIRDLDLEKYAPFSLVEVDNENVFMHDYDGKNLKSKRFDFENDLFFSSSSYKWDDVLDYRNKRFEKWQESRGFRITIPKIHLDRPPEKEEYSVLMKRDNSITKSITQAIIDEARNKLEVNYFYDPNNCFKKHSYYYDLSH